MRGIRTWIAAIGAVGLALALAHEAEASNWAQVSVGVPVSNAEIKASWSFDVTSDGPYVLGYGHKVNSMRRPVLFAHQQLGSDRRVVLDGGPGEGYEATVVPGSTGQATTVEATILPSAQLTAGLTVNFIVFVTAERFAAPPALTVQIDGKPVAAQYTLGDGARHTQLASGEGDTAAVSVAGATAAGPPARVTVSEGIVGAVNTDCVLGACEGSWVAPDGRTASASQTGYAIGSSGDVLPTFAGPAGTWTFAATGVFNGDFLASYVPIGTGWRLWANQPQTPAVPAPDTVTARRQVSGDLRLSARRSGRLVIVRAACLRSACTGSIRAVTRYRRIRLQPGKVLRFPVGVVRAGTITVITRLQGRQTASKRLRIRR